MTFSCVITYKAERDGNLMESTDKLAIKLPQLSQLSTNSISHELHSESSLHTNNNGIQFKNNNNEE